MKMTKESLLKSSTTLAVETTFYLEMEIRSNELSSFEERFIGIKAQGINSHCSKALK